ncbi:MAG: hypothetical protein ACI8Y7_001018 [Candidatus Woesearchaeota archaeon]|jgi:hypothetical protein
MALKIAMFGDIRLSARNYARRYQTAFEMLQPDIFTPKLPAKNGEWNKIEDAIATSDLLILNRTLLNNQLYTSGVPSSQLGDTREKIERLITETKREDAIVESGGFGTIRELHDLYDEQGIPNVRRMIVGLWACKPFFPVVIKECPSSCGEKIQLARNQADLAEIQLEKKDPFRIYASRFVECPSDYHAHIRVLTVGDNILASRLNYSKLGKEEDLKRGNIASNVSELNVGVPLYMQPHHNPNHTPVQRHVLEAHHIVDQKIPSDICTSTQKLTKITNQTGTFFSGIDYILNPISQRFEVLEVNSLPMTGAIQDTHSLSNYEAEVFLGTSIAHEVTRHLRR